MKTAHTPTPWKQYAYGEQIYGTQHPEKEGNFVCAVQSHFAKADAALIVKAVNEREGLIELAKAILGFEIATPKDYKTKGADAFSPLQKHIIDVQNKARVCLAKAEAA